MILFANTKDNFSFGIEFAPIMQFPGGLEIYFLHKQMHKSEPEKQFFYLTI